MQFIILLIISAAALLAYYFLFNVYESVFEVSQQEITADGKSVSEINAVPVNSLGFRALFRNAPAEFEITEGSGLVEIADVKGNEGKLLLRAKKTPGKIVVLIRCKSSLLPGRVEIKLISPDT